MALSRLKYMLPSVGLAVGLAAGAAFAQDVDEKITDGIREQSIAWRLPDNGDPGGVRKRLSERGIVYGANYTSEVLSNLAGGIRRGTIFEGKLETFVRADLEKAMGLRGLSFYSNQFQIHGTGGLVRDYVGNLITISAIEALPATRLSEIWLEQKLFGETASIRFGQLTTDSEFFISNYSELFLNADWPTITKINLPSGGPAYPLSTPGIRLKVDPNKHFSALVGLFNGDPAGPGPGSAEERNRTGTNFRVSDPPLLIGEVQYRYNQDKSATGLAGILRLGAWHHFGHFDDRRFDAGGLSLANPLSSGVARRLLGNDGIYGVVDQQIYRPAGGDANSGISLFSRISASPGDRNLINFYLDGGIVFSGLVAGRPDDKFGATFIYANMSDSVRALDRDRVMFTGMPQPIRDYELTLEFTYQAQIVPGWTLQPDFQVVFHPSGNVPDPTAGSSNSAIKNAVVFGLRSTMKY